MREVREPAKRRGVAPVQIVDCKQGRATGRDVGDEPVEAVQGWKRHIARTDERRRKWGIVEERTSKARRAGEQVGPLCRGCGGKKRLEQLPQHAKRKLLLELACARRQHIEACGASSLARRGDQARFAHAGAAPSLRGEVGLVGLIFASLGWISGAGGLLGALYPFSLAGLVAVIAWLLGGGALMLLALAHAELGGMYPVAGGSARSRVMP